MAISVLLKAFARRGQLPISLSSPAYESVFRNVNNSWNRSLSSKAFTSLGSRAFCSKPDHSDPVAQNQTEKLPESNLTKLVFKYVCADDESREVSRPFKPFIRKVLEIPRGQTFFEYKRKDDVSYINLMDFLYSYLMRLNEDAESTGGGERVSEVCFIEASFFKERIRRIMDRAGKLYNVKDRVDRMKRAKDPFPYRNKVIVDLDQLFDIRIWEKITSNDKQVLDIIVSELKRNGFDFTEDPMALQKVEEAVKRAMTRMTNEIKLDLPVPAGKPDMSTTISWGKCAGLPILRTGSLPPDMFNVCLAGVIENGQFYPIPRI
ncbi:hypothetical protein MKW94_020933 [Papaver nudicaule]|uniref:Uncharacterized protein n=1 Tax=Papaver nudicaule TaxID=74823 RepID=A0AA41S7L7_PAPNU|nr:hypothetical protein [Papaver nudicaule]